MIWWQQDFTRIYNFGLPVTLTVITKSCFQVRGSDLPITDEDGVEAQIHNEGNDLPGRQNKYLTQEHVVAIARAKCASEQLCEMRMSKLQVPNPYEALYLRTLYSEFQSFQPSKYRHQVDPTVFNSDWFHSTMASWWRASASSVSANTLILHTAWSRLQDRAGLRWSRYGLELDASICTDDVEQIGLFSKMQDGTEKCVYREDLQRELKIIQQSYFNSELSQYFFNVDQPNFFRRWDWSHQCGKLGRAPPPLSATDEKLIRDFRRDGFVRINHWEGLPALEDEGTRFGEQFDPGDPGLSRKNLLSHLLEENSLLRKLVHGYLQTSDVSYNGVSFGTLSSGTTYEDYDNGIWHHDGCGHRLKAFVYLTDVLESHGPRRSLATRIMKGTHRNMWFQPTQYFEGPMRAVNKLNMTEVHESFEGRVNYMWGKRFGGYIFDTHALHGVNLDFPDEKIPRQAFVLEFAALEHVEHVPRSFDGRHHSGQVHQYHCNPPMEHLRVNWKYCEKKLSEEYLGEDLWAGGLRKVLEIGDASMGPNKMVVQRHHHDLSTSQSHHGRPSSHGIMGGQAKFDEGNKVSVSTIFKKDEFVKRRQPPRPDKFSGAPHRALRMEEIIRRFFNPFFNKTEAMRLQQDIGSARKRNVPYSPERDSIRKREIKTYIPSKLELSWMSFMSTFSCKSPDCADGAFKKIACPLYVKSRSKILEMLAWTQQRRQTQIGRHAEIRPDQKEKAFFGRSDLFEVVSRVSVKTNDGNKGDTTSFAKEIPIEPLISALRHPEFGCGGTRVREEWMQQGREFIFNTSHIILPLSSEISMSSATNRGENKLANALFLNVPDRDRVLHFDVGAGWGVTDSILQFHKLYFQHGILIDQTYAWEPSALPGDVMEEAVRHEGMASLESWINSQLNTTEFKNERANDAFDTLHLPIFNSRRTGYVMNFFARPGNSIIGHVDNPLTQIAKTAKPTDYVILKLDIDFPELEADILYQILSKSRADFLIPCSNGRAHACASVRDEELDNVPIHILVDEIFLEHHVSFHPISNWWGMHTPERFATAAGNIASGFVPGQETNCYEQDLRLNNPPAGNRLEFAGIRSLLEPTLSKSFKLLYELRRKGIRAHAWV